MKDIFVLGIDCGGTHTDAALLAVSQGRARLLASAKTSTNHADLPASVRGAVEALLADAGGEAKNALGKIERATLGTTLEINAITQDKADKVGLALSAGPGLDPAHFGLGGFVCIVPGGLDHRGVEVSPLYTENLREEARKWAEKGARALACVSKFSPRNPAHEEKMAQAASEASGLPATMGHSLSGRLNFPRRVATAYYNAAVAALHINFLDAVEKALSEMGLHSSLRLLKADGGALPFSLSRREPVQSILSGPAASVMGALAIWKNAGKGCSLLLDMGGTTTDIAMILDGSPVVDRAGMAIKGRRTLVRSLASVSIGVGGDSSLRKEGESTLVGPLREGPAMAFGGQKPTLLDALNYLDGENSTFDRGDVSASRRGIEHLALSWNMKPGDLARTAAENAMSQISKAAYDLVENINARPIYTLAALKAAKEARPAKLCVVGGPAQCVQSRLAAALGMDVEIAPHPQVANAIGAALTLPTASLEIYVDTGKGLLSAPAYDFHEKAPKNFTLEQARNRARELLEAHLASEGMEDAKVEIVEADLFATLDDRGYGSKDMRVSCQARPGILAHLED